MFLFLAVVIKVSTIPVKSILRGMKPLIMILVFTGILNLFFTQEGKVLVDFWVITITAGGLQRAIFMVFRILMLVTGESKADVLAQAVEGPVTSMITASALQLHPHVIVVADEAAAAKLQGRAYYDWVFQNEPKWAAYRNI